MPQNLTTLGLLADFDLVAPADQPKWLRRRVMESGVQRIGNQGALRAWARAWRGVLVALRDRGKLRPAEYRFAAAALDIAIERFTEPEPPTRPAA